MLSGLLERLIGKPVLEKVFGSVTRHLLGLLSGVLLAQGIDPELVAKFIESSNQIALAVAGIVITLVLSLREKGKK